jgi:hypothetical protein
VFGSLTGATNSARRIQFAAGFTFQAGGDTGRSILLPDAPAFS